MITYAGQGITIGLTFADADGTATDPDTVALIYRDAAGVDDAVTKALADLTKVSTGKYTLAIDTTDFAAGRWDVQVTSTGAVPAVSVATFDVTARPLG